MCHGGFSTEARKKNSKLTRLQVDLQEYLVLCIECQGGSVPSYLARRSRISNAHPHIVVNVILFWCVETGFLSDLRSFLNEGQLLHAEKLFVHSTSAARARRWSVLGGGRDVRCDAKVFVLVMPEQK